MSTDVFTLDCEALPGLRLSGFKGTEILSRPYEFDLFFTVPVGSDIKSAVGARATLTADRSDDRGPMCWQGILAGIRLLHETAEHALYRASLVPELWLLAQHVRSFVHTKKKIDAYVSDTLKAAGFTGADFDFRTNGTYPDEEFVCQYRESHLDFLQRWCEREGLYYYFEHPEGPGAHEKLVFADDKAHHSPLLGDGHVRYSPTAAHDGSAGECLRELSADYRLLPASVLVTDYNYANPAAPVAGEKPVTTTGQGQIREYGYRVFTEGEAKRLAQVKAQSIACRELTLTATGTYLGLRAGYTFQLDDAPSDLPPKYLAIEVRHTGLVTGAPSVVRRYTGLDTSETYRVDVTAIPADVQYRAPQSTPWPRIYGFENGTIDGPAESQYAQIDDQGRYLVRFKFDASDLPDGSTSTYLRMMQPHGGTTEGFHFPLRKGTEVMVSFQGGDPDRPVIAGVVPNAVQPSNVTNRNYSQNVLRTSGGSYMVMDDLEERQYVDTFVKVGNTGVHMGHKAPLTVDVPASGGPFADEPNKLAFTYAVDTEGDAGFKVGGCWWQWVGDQYWLDVTGTGTVRYKGTYTLHAKSLAMELYYSHRTVVISGPYTQNVEQGGVQTVTGDWSQDVSGMSSGRFGGLKTVVAGSWDATVGGSTTHRAGAAISLQAPSIKLQCGEYKLIAPGGTHKNTPLSTEFYGSKDSAGVQKFDACAISLSFAASSLSRTNFKLDSTHFKVEHCAFKARIGPETATAQLSLKNAGLAMVCAGLQKLG